MEWCSSTFRTGREAKSNGGEVKVRSVAAGLPLIVLGVISVALAVANWPLSPIPRDGPTPVSDPEKTVRALLTAWNRGDRDTALKMAERGTVDKLFSASSLKVNSKELTCYPVGTGQRDCQLAHPKGILIFRLLETDQGWWIESVEY